MPSTSGRNVLPAALARRISKDFGNDVESREVGTATAAGEAKNKRTFFDKESDPVNFLPVHDVLAGLQGRSVFIVEDVHNTGESWIAFARMLMDGGLQVDGVATLVSTEQRITSPRDIERLSEKVAAHLGQAVDEVRPAMHSLFDGTFKQLFNKAEADVTRSAEKAARLFEIAASGRRAGAYSNPLRSGAQGQRGLLGTREEGGLTQGAFSFSIARADLGEYLAAQGHEGNTLAQAVRETGDLFAWGEPRPGLPQSPGAGADGASGRSAQLRGQDFARFATVAQPNNLLSRSLGEAKLTQNPLGGFLFLFASEMRKNFAIGIYALRKVATGKGAMSRGMATQQLVVLGAFYSALGFLIRAGYEGLFKAEDDEPEEILARLGERLTDPKAWAYSLATEHLRGVPLIGEAANHLGAFAFDQKAYDASPNPLNQIPKAVRIAANIGDEDNTPEETAQNVIDAIQAAASMTPETAILAQSGNVAEDVLSLLTGNGMELSNAERTKRIKSRYQRLGRELNEEHGRTTGEDGKTDKAIQARKWEALAGKLRTELAPLDPEARAKALEAIAPPQGVRDLISP